MSVNFMQRILAWDDDDLVITSQTCSGAAPAPLRVVRLGEAIDVKLPAFVEEDGVLARAPRQILAEVMSHVLVLELILEFFQQACGEAGPFQMQANLVERIIGRTRLRAPIHGAHDDVIRIPQEKFRVDLGILHGNEIDHAI